MERVNALGLICPQPIIEAKKAIAKLPTQGGIVEVLVDNLIATENLAKMCQQKGYGHSMNKRADREYAVQILVGEGQIEQTYSQPSECFPIGDGVVGDGLVVAIGGDRMGSGDEALGKILIKGFIFSLANLDTPPKALLFFNSGVKLVLENANTIDDIKTLLSKGTEVLVCGTCVDFYNCKSQVAVGEITNMYDIVEKLRQANSVINI